MRHSIALIVAALIAGRPAAAAAQDARPFEGAYAGPEIGAHEHHFYIETTDLVTGDMRGRYYRAWGIGGGAFAGYDLAVSDAVRVGAEAEVSLGGATNRLDGYGGTFAQHPRYGYRVVGRIGRVLGDRTMVYGSLGYGGHRYGIEDSIGIEDTRAWQSSFVVGGGVAYRIGRRVDVRLDFKHLDNSMSHILLGVPIRF